MLGMQIDGRLYPVTDAFYAFVLEPRPWLIGADHDALEGERKRLLVKSNGHWDETGFYRVGLGPDDRDWLEAVTHTVNVHRAVRWMRGAPHSAFGFAGVDQVHGNEMTWQCGCITSHVFDHYKRLTTPELMQHTPKMVCGDHFGANSPDGLFHMLQREFGAGRVFCETHERFE